MQNRSNEQEPDLANDERGAVMVLGIFMCACLVGALWYLAGIGDAIVYRERLQDAADATAFSAAVLHARGMNLIVLINLVMACILAIRVTLKVLQVALIAAGIIFAALFFIPGAEALSATCFELAAYPVQTAINVTREPINKALMALSKVEIAVAHVIPLAAVKASYDVANKYKPTLDHGFSGTGVDRLASGLPVEEGTTDRLCYEAGVAFTTLLEWLIPIGALKPGSTLGDKFSDIMGDIISGGAGYFCELGGAGGPPDLSGLMNSSANESCDGKFKDLQKKFDEANTAWHTDCDKKQVICTDANPDDPDSPTWDSSMTDGDPQRQPPLPNSDWATLRGEMSARDGAMQSVRGFNGDQCRDDFKKDANKKMQQMMPQQQQQQGAQNMTPKKVEKNWANGRNDAQMMAWVFGDDHLLRLSPKGVKIGAMNDQRAGDIGKPVGADFAVAQAEFFYDCDGDWKSDSCNGHHNDGEEAMWHFRWRARFRRYNRPYNDLPALIETPYLLASMGSLANRARGAVNIQGNPALKAKVFLSGGIDPKSFVMH